METTVSKFGGTSMADANAIQKSANLAVQQKSRLVVVSATSGTTNQLIETAQAFEKQNERRGSELIKLICHRHSEIAKKLGLSPQSTDKLHALFEELQSLARGIFLLREANARTLDVVQSLGERMSSLLFEEAWRKAFLNQGLKKDSEKVQWIDARKYLITDDQYGRARPQISEISSKCETLRHSIESDEQVFITQGFIGATLEGITTTLGRGGSDFSAALFAEGLQAKILEIWTDVPGIATTDPRICPEARPIDEISFTETSELATFGAKVLHPATLAPAMRANVPVFVGSTFESEKKGTWVKKAVNHWPTIRAVATRRKQVLLTLSTPDMVNAYGFLAKIFEVFNRHKVSIDAITTSEISVAMTLDESALSANSKVVEELKLIADVQIEKGLALVALIGNQINHTAGLAEKAFAAIADINVRMICLGASRHNFCFVISDSQAEEAVRRLHKTFIK